MSAACLEIQHAGTWKTGQTMATRRIDFGINDHTWPFFQRNKLGAARAGKDQTGKMPIAGGMETWAWTWRGAESRSAHPPLDLSYVGIRRRGSSENRLHKKDKRTDHFSAPAAWCLPPKHDAPYLEQHKARLTSHRRLQGTI
jgi:hypothetical protein